jgi:fructose-bisphosphate aldolase class II
MEPLSKLMSKGFIYGNSLSKLYQYAKENQFALPAVNVIGTSSINAALAAAQLLSKLSRR